MPRGLPLSPEKSLRRQEIRTAIGQQLREHYNVSQSPSDRLADLVKKIERSNHSEPLPQDEERPATGEERLTVAAGIYHTRQAATLRRLADSTRNPAHAAAVRRLATGHDKLAVAAEGAKADPKKQD